MYPPDLIHATSHAVMTERIARAAAHRLQRRARASRRQRLADRLVRLACRFAAEPLVVLPRRPSSPPTATSRPAAAARRAA